MLTGYKLDINLIDNVQHRFIIIKGVQELMSETFTFVTRHENVRIFGVFRTNKQISQNMNCFL